MFTIVFSEGTIDFTGFFEAIKQLPETPYLIIEVVHRDHFVISLQKLREMGF